jgi:hypothetical protein
MACDTNFYLSLPLGLQKYPKLGVDCSDSVTYVDKVISVLQKVSTTGRTFEKACEMKVILV